MPNTIFYTASNLTHAFKSGYMKTWSLKIQYWSVPKKQMEYIYIYIYIYANRDNSLFQTTIFVVNVFY